jgi:AcrR family transcriptional regulator
VQAAETRRQILSSAQTLFERGGFAGTSIAAIAAAAGVSLKTVYLAFETKSGLLRALWHMLLRGDDDGVPVGDRRWYREVIEEPDPERQLRLNMRNSRIVKVRAGAMLEVIRTAAAVDTDVAELWRRIEVEFYGNQHGIVESLAAKGALAPGLDVDSATDMLWTLNHPAVYALLAEQRGWPAERFEQWVGDVVCSQLLAPPPG